MFTSYRVIGALLLFSLNTQVPGLHQDVLSAGFIQPVHVLSTDHIHIPPSYLSPVMLSSDLRETTGCGPATASAPCLKL